MYEKYNLIIVTEGKTKLVGINARTSFSVCTVTGAATASVVATWLYWQLHGIFSSKVWRKCLRIIPPQESLQPLLPFEILAVLPTSFGMHFYLAHIQMAEHGATLVRRWGWGMWSRLVWQRGLWGLPSSADQVSLKMPILIIAISCAPSLTSGSCLTFSQDGAARILCAVRAGLLLVTVLPLCESKMQTCSGILCMNTKDIAIYG